MTIAYQTPGVYYERVDAEATGIHAVRMDVAGFVGIARRGPLHGAIPVQSWRQFEAYFGEFTGAGYLAYAVRGFFENGGRKCWVVRVASEAADTAELTTHTVPPANTVWRIKASSPGVWGNDLDLTLKETHRAQTLTKTEDTSPRSSVVNSVTGFARGTHVRVSQTSATTAYKVVSDVDAVESRLIWMHDQSEARLPYDAPLTGFDLTRPIVVESIEYTVVVRELGRAIRSYENLSLVPQHPRYGVSLLAPLKLKDEVGRRSQLPAAPEPIIIEELREIESLTDIEPLQVTSDKAIPLAGGADGLALLQVADFIGEESSPLESDEVKARKRRGLRALEDVREVAILSVPDIHIQPVEPPAYSPPPPCVPDPCLPTPPPAPATPRKPSVGDLPPKFSEDAIYQVQAAQIEQCERLRDRIALLDPPFAVARDDAFGVGAARAWRRRFDSKYGAFYYPWLRVVDPLRRTLSLTRDIPPGGHVAGQYARTDAEVGVHKAPANAPLAWAQDVTVQVSDATQGALNPAGINAIRALAGRGLRIYGARTVSSDADWRFVNVRRLLMMIGKSIDLSTQWATFEPNNWMTRAKLRLALDSFLSALWQQGALMGDSVGQAFYVKCDEANNPASERENGRLWVEVGVAPSQPFEFVVLRVGRAGNEFEVSELMNTRGGL